MKTSTAVPTKWAHSFAQVGLAERAITGEVSSTDSFFGEEYYIMLSPEEGLALRSPVRLRVQRDDGGFVVSDDFSDVYGEGESRQEAVEDYLHALEGLERVLAEREDELPEHLAARLAAVRDVLT